MDWAPINAIAAALVLREPDEARDDDAVHTVWGCQSGGGKGDGLSPTWSNHGPLVGGFWVPPKDPASGGRKRPIWSLGLPGTIGGETTRGFLAQRTVDETDTRHDPQPWPVALGWSPPTGWPCVALAGTERQGPAAVQVYPFGGALVAAWHGGPPTHSTPVFDVVDHALDLERQAPLHTALRVVRLGTPVAPAPAWGPESNPSGTGTVERPLVVGTVEDTTTDTPTPPALAVLALQLGAPGWGAVAETILGGKTQRIGWLAAGRGGPIFAGFPGDKHTEGTGPDGDQYGPAHLATWAIWAKDPSRDSPMEFQDLPYLSTTPGCFLAPTHLRHDERADRWRFETETPWAWIDPPPEESGTVERPLGCVATPHEVMVGGLSFGVPYLTAQDLAALRRLPHPSEEALELWSSEVARCLTIEPSRSRETLDPGGAWDALRVAAKSCLWLRPPVATTDFEGTPTAGSNYQVVLDDALALVIGASSVTDGEADDGWMEELDGTDLSIHPVGSEVAFKFSTAGKMTVPGPLDPTYLDTDDQAPAPDAPAADHLRWFSTAGVPYVRAPGGAANAILTASAAALAYQPLDSDLTSLAALGSAADKIAYTTGAHTWAEADLSTFARTILDDANAAAVLATIGAAASGHNHDATYLGLAAQAADSALLAGENAAHYHDAGNLTGSLALARLTDGAEHSLLVGGGAGGDPHYHTMAELAPDLAAIEALTPSDGDVLTYDTDHWTSAAPTGGGGTLQTISFTGYGDTTGEFFLGHDNVYTQAALDAGTTNHEILFDGTITKVAWNSKAGDATTDIKFWVNGVVDDKFDFDGSEGVAVVDVGVTSGDYVALEEDAGTHPLQCHFQLAVT